MPEISNGFILLARSLLTSQLMEKPPLYAKIWLFLLLKAQFKDGRSLKRGQVLTSLQGLMEAGSFKIGFRREYPTKKQVRDVLEWFREQGMIRTRKTTRGLVITIVNYDLYQDPDNYARKSDEGHNERHGEGHGERHTLSRGISEIRKAPGHSEGHGESSMKVAVRAHYRGRMGECNNEKNEEGGVNDSAPSSGAESSPRSPREPDRSELLSGITNDRVRELLETVIEKIALTRKTGKIAESVVLSFLRKALQFEEWKIGTAAVKYLEKEHWLDGKGEKYLLGIMRGVTYRDYQEVAGSVRTNSSDRANQRDPPLTPRTYAQARDAERRSMAEQLLDKKRRSGDEQEGKDTGGADQADHSLPGGETQHGGN